MVFEKIPHGAWWIARHLKILFNKWSKPDRERQISCDIAYMWNLKKNDINELIYKTEIDPQT